MCLGRGLTRPFTLYYSETRSVIVSHLLHVSQSINLDVSEQSRNFRFVIYSPALPLCFFPICSLMYCLLLPSESFGPPPLCALPIYSSDLSTRLLSTHTQPRCFPPLSLPLSVCPRRTEQYFTTHNSCVSSTATFPIKSMSQQMSFNFYLLWCNDIFCLFYSWSAAFAITTLFPVSKKSY